LASWSPTGDKIAYYNWDYTGNLKVMTVAGVLLEVDETNPYDFEPPVWIGAATATPKSVGFEIAQTDIEENVGNVNVVVKRNGDSGVASSVDYTTINGTATSPSDFTAISGTLNFAIGETTKTISVPIIDDIDAENAESFSLSLSNPTGDFYLAESNHTVNIARSDLAVIGFSTSTFRSISESAGTVSFTVSRTGNTSIVASVDYVTYNITATTPDDYIQTSGTLTFAVGETEKIVTVSIVNDAVIEPTEDFAIQISNPVAAEIGNDFNRISILNDDSLVQFNVGTLIVEERATNQTYTANVERSGLLTGTTTVDYAIVPTAACNGVGGVNCATAAEDYTVATGTVTFVPNQNSRTISFTVLADSLPEQFEEFSIVLSNAVGSTIGTRSQKTVRITENDLNTFTMVITNNPIAENAGFLTVTVNKTVNSPNSLSSTVDYITQNGAATSPQDFTTTSGTLTFLPSETTKTFNIPIINDTIGEFDEHFFVQIRNARNGGYINSIDNQQISVTISGNDQVSVGGVSQSVAENEGSVDVQVTRTFDLSIPTTVSYSTANSTATSGQDYTAVSGTLSFAAGEVSKTVTIPILDDTLNEENETFRLTFSNPSSGTIIDSSPTITILDNDVRYKMTSIFSASVNEGQGVTSISVTKLDDFDVASSVSYDATNGTAVSPDDFAGGIGTINFAVGETKKNILIPIVQDVSSEADETFYVTLLPSATAIIESPSQKLITIIDDDPKIKMELSSVTVNESDGTADLKIIRLNSNALTATVNYSTSPFGATSGVDYTSVSGTVAFNSGESEKIISIPIMPDSIAESSESFDFNLSSPNGAILVSPVSTRVTIVDNSTKFDLSVTKPECRVVQSFGGLFVNCSDYSPRFRWEFYEFLPGNIARWEKYFDLENTPTQTVTVKRSGGRVDQEASVDYATSDLTAIAGQDYTATSGTLVFAPNEVAKTFEVPITNDSIGEGYEQLKITLSNPTNLHVIGKSTVNMGILDSYVGFSQFDENGWEITNTRYGESETSAFGSVPVYRTGDLSNSLTVNYATSDATATAGSDYTTVSGTLTFAIGESVKYIEIPIFYQSAIEGTESFQITLSDVVGDGVIAGETVDFEIYETFAYIPCYHQTDDTLSSSCRYGTYLNITTPESAANVQIKVRIAGERIGPVSIDYATSDQTAIAGEDYTATSGTLNFAINESEKFITVPILNDSVAETAETFKVTLSNLIGDASILESNSVSTVTITDAVVRLSASQALETNSSNRVVISRSGDLNSALTVGYSTADNTATAGQDYTATSGTVTFAAGETSKFFDVPILDDNINEPIELVNLTINLSGTEAVLDQNSVTNFQIKDTLSNVSIALSPATINENTTIYTATISRSSNINHPFSVDYQTLNGTAIAGSDFTTVSGTMNFAAGETQKNFELSINNDSLVEGNETFTLEILNSTGETTITNARRTVSIIDDDVPPKFKFLASPFVINESAGNALITVQRTGDATAAISVNVATSNGTATAGSDYTAVNTTLNFVAGETSKSFNVPILDDAVTEGTQYLNLTLSNPIGATIETPNPVRLNISEIKPQVQLPNWTLSIISSGGILMGKHLAGIAFNPTNKDVYIASDTGQLQNAEEIYFDLFKIDSSGNQTQIGTYLVPHYDLVNLEFNPTDGLIYVAGTDRVVYRINPANGAISVFNSNLGLTFFRNGLEFNSAGELIFMPEGNPNSFYRVNAGSGLTLLGSVTADNNSNYGTRFGIQPDGDYVIYPDGDVESNPRITQVNPNSFAFNYLSPTNVRTLGSAFGHSIGSINPENGDIFSSGGNFGLGSSVIQYTNGANSLQSNKVMAGETVQFITNIGNSTVDGQNNLTAKGVVDMEFGARRDNQNGHCLYFVDDVDDTVYQACQLLAPTAANATISGKITSANGRPIRNVAVMLTDMQTGESRRNLTGQFGRYTFTDVAVGKDYVIEVSSKRYTFKPNSRLISLNEDLDNEDFVATQ
jgi:hypothetical protein